MQVVRTILALFLPMTIMGCGVSVKEPVVSSTVNINISGDDLVNQVKHISNCLDLSFHYGSSDQPYGVMMTFRLIGKGYEIVIYNPDSKSNYYIRAYMDDGKNNLRELVDKSVDRVKEGLMNNKNIC